MNALTMRIFFILFCAAAGYYVVYEFNYSIFQAAWGLAVGLLISVLILITERSAVKHPLRTIIGACSGLIFGLVIANLFSFVLLLGLIEKRVPSLLCHILVNSIFGYLGLKIGAVKGQEFKISDLKEMHHQEVEESPKILDTSVIIDGRLADLCETGFIEGAFIVPQFILQELQHIADSSDSTKRTRGRRGLDILNKMQRQVNLDVRVVEHDFPKIRDVDTKLVALGKKMRAKIITNDFNLNKVAELQGVSVLNINQLANALKPVVLPGEAMNVRILKEGKELGQGVAYLDDGTMVVVDNAKKYVGKNVDVTVTSVLQTTAGRMIFTILRDEAAERLVHNISY